MLRHTLKLIWNQRQNYTGILVEQTLVFIILMLCITTFSETVQQYLSPGILNTEDTYSVGFANKISTDSRKEMERKLSVVVEKTKISPTVIATSKTTDMAPYFNDGNFLAKDSLTMDGRKILVYIKSSDAGGFEVYQPELEEGTWLNGEKREDGSYSAVISRQLVEEMGWSNALGKRVQYNSLVFTVVGIVSGIKYLPLRESPAVLIMPENIHSRPTREHSIRIKPGEDEAFVSAFYKEFRKIFPDKTINPSIDKLDDWKISQIFGTLISFAFLAIPTFFLVIFAFIGTFGLFWMHSRKRRKEYALRLALGATRHGLIGFVIREGCFITLFSILPGLLLFCLIYEFNTIHFIALGITLIVIFLFSIGSAWIPARQVSRIDPAETLHYE